MTLTGFPADLTADVAREEGFALDMSGFDQAMEEQRNRARAASQFQLGEVLEIRVSESTEFLGYQAMQSEGQVLLLVRDGKEVDILRAGEDGWVILDRTAFYAESGGQVGDQGEIEANGMLFKVTGARYLSHKVIAHVGILDTGEIHVGDQVNASVNDISRQATMGNHSATHLLHAALQEVVGQHVEQKGSLVEPHRLRFDFSHGEAVDTLALDNIEKTGQ